MPSEVPLPVYKRPEVPRVLDAWYILATTDELGPGQLRKTSLYGMPIVLFRTASGRASALLDRCPHRNVPLSMGKVIGDHLQCAYHGWEFDAEGECQKVPSYLGEPGHSSRCATRFPTVEQQGYVWVWANPGSEPVGQPFSFPIDDDGRYLTVRHQARAAASVHMVAENALDVPHTAYLHGGLFRNPDSRSRIEAVVRRWHDRCECEYIGEPRPKGLAGRILAPGGGVVTHFDRFFLPSIVQVEYRLGDDAHIVTTAASTPLDDYDTVLYSVVRVRTRIPGWLIRPVLQPIALRIFGQDAVVLAEQTEHAYRFGNQTYASTDADLLGPHILKLMNRAAAGDLEPRSQPWTRSIEMEV